MAPARAGAGWSTSGGCLPGGRRGLVDQAHGASGQASAAGRPAGTRPGEGIPGWSTSETSPRVGMSGWSTRKTAVGLGKRGWSTRTAAGPGSSRADARWPEQRLLVRCGAHGKVGAMSQLPRVLEPEVMDDEDEAADYDAMDHGGVNARFVDDLLALAPDLRAVLDVGTGTALIPLELVRRESEAQVLGVDLASTMLDLAREHVVASGREGAVVLEAAGSTFSFSPCITLRPTAGRSRSSLATSSRSTTSCRRRRSRLAMATTPPGSARPRWTRATSARGSRTSPTPRPTSTCRSTFLVHPTLRRAARSRRRRSRRRSSRASAGSRRRRARRSSWSSSRPTARWSDGSRARRTSSSACPPPSGRTRRSSRSAASSSTPSPCACVARAARSASGSGTSVRRRWSPTPAARCRSRRSSRRSAPRATPRERPSSRSC